MSLTAVKNVVDLQLRSVVIRGLLAGLVAGLLAGGLAFFTGESLVDQAIAMEESGPAPQSHDSTASAADHSHDANAAVEGHSHGTENDPMITRDGQRTRLFLATSLTGGALGVPLAVV